MNNCFFVYGMRRSGLHCVCLDIIQTYQLNNNDNNDIQFINNTNYDNYEKIYLDNKNNIHNKMFLFEDKFYYNFDSLKNNNENTKTIIIIRDIYDNIISRIKKNRIWSVIDNNFITTYIDILREILGVTNYYKHDNKVIIDYNKYIDHLHNPEYRKQILLSTGFNFKNIGERYNKISHYGEGPTFKKNESRLNVKLNKNIIELISDNKEFLHLCKLYFKYDVLEKLKNHTIV